MTEKLEETFLNAIASKSRNEQLTEARRVLDMNVLTSNRIYGYAICVLLNNDYCDEARFYLEQALFNEFDKVYQALLPLLAHTYQRQFDFINAHLLYSVCARLNLLNQEGGWAAHEDARVACGLAEHLFFSNLHHESLYTLGVRSRALYEIALSQIQAKPGNGEYNYNRVLMPNFLVVGSAKCGTSFIYELICQSPDVWHREPKELHFFTNYFNFGKAFYSRFFSACPEGLICGEASPDYFDICHPILDNYVDVAHRIYNIIPEAKIIIVLRDPVDRAISLYNQLITNINSAGPCPGQRKIEDLSLNDLEKFNNGYILKSGHYVVALRRFVELFGLNRVLVITFAEFANLPRLSNRVSDFLGISNPKLCNVESIATNAGGHMPARDELYNCLREYYKESLLDLSNEFSITI